MATIYGLCPISNSEFLNTLGEPAVGWKLYHYVDGSPAVTYMNDAGTYYNTVPIVLNSRGEPDYDVFLDGNVAYTVTLKDGDGATIFSKAGVYAIVGRGALLETIHAGPGTINVLDYGAVADGTTNDTAAFTGAIAACYLLSRSTLLVPPGEYLVSLDQIYLPTGCTMTGGGTLIPDATVLTGAVVRALSVSNIVVDNIHVDLSGITSAPDNQWTNAGMFFTAVSRLTVRHSSVIGKFRLGIRGYQCSLVSIHDNDIQLDTAITLLNAGLYFTDSEGKAFGYRVEHNNIVNTGTNFFGCTYGVFVGNNIYNNAYGAGFCNGTYGGSIWSVTGNSIVNGGEDPDESGFVPPAIVILGAGTSISGNVMQGNHGPCITMGAAHCLLDSNIIIGNATGPEFIEEDEYIAYYCTVTGNIICDNTGYGISFAEPIEEGEIVERDTAVHHIYIDETNVLMDNDSGNFSPLHGATDVIRQDYYVGGQSRPYLQTGYPLYIKPDGVDTNIGIVVEPKGNAWEDHKSICYFESEVVQKNNTWHQWYNAAGDTLVPVISLTTDDNLSIHPGGTGSYIRFYDKNWNLGLYMGGIDDCNKYLAIRGGNNSYPPMVAGMGTGADLVLYAEGAKGKISMYNPVQLHYHSVAGLESAHPAADHAYCLVGVSDGTGNKRLAISDGTNWRFPDGDIIS